MKESKKFFDKNRLNKGYSNVNTKQSDVSVIRKKYQHILPPIEMLEEYEELNPGTFEKLFNMAEKEQKHRHSMDLLTTEKYIRATHLGRMFALVFVILVAIITLTLAVAGSIISSSVFAISAFACITIISYFYSKTPVYKESVRTRPNESRPQRNNRSFTKKPRR